MEDGTGFIYIVKLTERDNVYKVGTTNNMIKRLDGIRAKYTLGVRILHGDHIDDSNYDKGVYLKFLAFTMNKLRLESLVNSIFYEYSYCEPLMADRWSLRGNELYKLSNNEYEDMRLFIIKHGGEHLNKSVYDQLNSISYKYGGLKQ